jgi:putative addiction module component (TIGR02574 family)
MAIDVQELLALSRKEKLAIIEALSDSLDVDEAELSDAELAELDRRVEAYKANPSSGVPVDAVLARLRARYET